MSRHWTLNLYGLLTRQQTVVVTTTFLPSRVWVSRPTSESVWIRWSNVSTFWIGQGHFQ